MAKKIFKNLTDKVVGELEATGKPYDVFDKDFPRMWVAVGATGTKTFYIRVQVNGKRRKPNLGNFPATSVTKARQKAAEALDPISHERDPEVLKPCLTVKEIYYETRHQQIDMKLAQEDTWDQPYWHAFKCANDNMKKVGNLSFWERPLSDISKRELVKIYKWMNANFSPSVPGHFRTVMTKIYSYAYDEGYEGIEHNLGRDLQDVVIEKRSRKKTRGALTWNALKLLWFWLDDVVALCAMSARLGLIFKIMAYTGLRAGAVRQLKHEDFNVMDDWLVVPPERDKTKIKFMDDAVPKFIYLGPTMQELYAQIPQPSPVDKDGWCFPSRVGRCAGRPIGKTSVKWKGFFDKRANPDLSAGQKGYREIDIERFERVPPPVGLRELVPHELRHTVTTRALDEVRPKGLVSRMVGHKGRFDTLGQDEQATIEDIQTITRGYAHCTFFNDESYREELKQAWLTWDERFRTELGLDKVPKTHHQIRWPGRASNFKSQKGLRI